MTRCPASCRRRAATAAGRRPSTTYQRLNYNVVRIHQEPASPYMLDVADEMGLMIIDETAIRGSNNTQDFVAGHDNMVNHARALVLRDRNHPAVIRWSQANEPTGSTFDSEQFEQDLYAAMNGSDGTRPISVDAGVGASPNHYPGMTYANFNLVPHYLDGFGHYGESLWSGTGRPVGEGEYIWPACSTKQGFEWFATATAAKRGKDASDLRPYTLLSAWAGVVPGVKTTDFTPEEGGHPVYGADNLTDPWSNPQIQRIQAAFNPIAAIDLPYWSASGASDANGDLPAPPGGARLRPRQHGDTQHHRVQRRLQQHLRRLRLDGAPDTRQAARSSRPAPPLSPSRSAPASPSRSRSPPRPPARGYTWCCPPASPAPPRSATRSSTSPWAASSGPTPGTYHIVNRNSGKPLAIAGNSTADGAKAVQQSGGLPWTISTAPGGTFTLAYTGSGKVLDVNGGSSTAGLQLQQWTANGGTNQQWYLKPTGDGYYTIVSHDSGLVADVYGRSTSDGAQVVQWTANGGTNQQWQLAP